jgi:hypothetical protein
LKGYGLTVDQSRSRQESRESPEYGKLDWFRLRPNGALDLYEF